MSLVFSEFTDGRSAFLYVLFEHKSRPAALVAIQLLGYMVQIWGQSSRERPATEVPGPVIPVVVYHGARRWNVALNCGSLFPGPEA